MNSVCEVQSRPDNMASNKPSYEARGGGGSIPSLRTKFKDRKFRRWLLKELPHIVKYDLTKLAPHMEKVIVDVHNDYSHWQEQAAEATDETKKQQYNKKSKACLAAMRRIFVMYQLFHANGDKCYICEEKKSFEGMTQDHVFPKYLGYPLQSNKMPACRKCNEDKGHRIPSTEELHRTCEAYEKIGALFDPRLPHETGHAEFLKPFKSIGLRRFIL